MNENTTTYLLQEISKLDDRINCSKEETFTALRASYSMPPCCSEVSSASAPLQNIMKKGCNVGWTASAPVLIQMVVLSLQRSFFTRSLSASNSIKTNLRRTSSLKSSTTEMNRGSLDYFGLTAVNSFLKYLNAESTEGKQQHSPRQIYKSHFTSVLPEPVPTPYMIIGSKSCAQSLGLDPAEMRTLKFVKAFSGNVLMPGLDTPYSSNYGCHCYSSWFGQLGDGRAMALGEVAGGTGDHYELQLKGCGRSPYSRGFDGRAVLRSSIREFLVSEAMFHLGESEHSCWHMLHVLAITNSLS
jgi:Protein adenylyltransferase SelO